MSFSSITPGSPAPIDKGQAQPSEKPKSGEEEKPIQEIAQNALQSPGQEIGSAAPLTLSNLNVDGLFHITEKLLPIDRLALESTSKSFTHNMDYYWRQKIAEEHLGDLKFAIQDPPKSSREQYLFSKAVMTLVETLAIKGFNRDSAQIGVLSNEELKLLEKYEFLEKSFPRLHNLLQFAIYHRAGVKRDLNPYHALTENDRKAILAQELEDNPGDLLLQCLLADSLLEVQLNLNNAGHGSQAAALLTTQMKGLDDAIYLRAAQSEAKRGNFLPLHDLFKFKPEFHERCNESWPPVLVVNAAKLLSQAPTETKYAEAESLLAKAVSGFGKQTPIEVLAFYSHVKLKLNKTEEAEDICTKLGVSSLTFEEVDAEIKDKAEMLVEAGHPPLFAGNFSPTLKSLFVTIDIKMKLEKWEEADKLLNVTLQVFEHNKPRIRENLNDTLVQAAYVKIKLGKWEEAKELFAKIYTIDRPTGRFVGERKDLFAAVGSELAKYDAGEHEV